MPQLWSLIAIQVFTFISLILATLIGIRLLKLNRNSISCIQTNRFEACQSNPLVQVVRHLRSKEIIRNQSIIVALIEGPWGAWLSGCVGIYPGKKWKKKKEKEKENRSEAWWSTFEIEYNRMGHAFSCDEI